jgi:hypothetical protein
MFSPGRIKLEGAHRNRSLSEQQHEYRVRSFIGGPGYSNVVCVKEQSMKRILFGVVFTTSVSIPEAIVCTNPIVRDIRQAETLKPTI